MNYEELINTDLHGCAVKFHGDFQYYVDLADKGFKVIPSAFCALRKDFMQDQMFYVEKDTGTQIEIKDQDGTLVMFPKWTIKSYVRLYPSWRWHLSKLLGI